MNILLKNVLADYLSRLKSERAFDAPFLALLAAMGFYDLHFTHGQVEFGKDFIGKLDNHGTTTQYSFQSKCGDINQTEWRNAVQGQMLEAIISGLSHPNFDLTLPHQCVLVMTGRLSGNAALGMQDLNVRIEEHYGLIPIKVWDNQDLICFLALHGSEGIHNATAASFIGFGRFYIAYGKSYDGDLSCREIELYSREWMQDSIPSNSRVFGAVLEATILAAKCQEKGCFYEAIHCVLGAIRAVMYTLHIEPELQQQQWLVEVYQQTLASLYSMCDDFVSACRLMISGGNNNLLNKIEGYIPIITYPVCCFRIMEMTGLLYFLSRDVNKQKDLVDFLSEFVSQEPGCHHLVSDRDAVALVLTVLTLRHADHFSDAKDFLQRNVVWLCDRYENGFGLADFNASAYDEVTTLLGYAFQAIHVTKRSSSFAATALSDLAAFLDDAVFYKDVVNDFKACGIAFSYWQPKDSVGQFLITAEDLIQYPNIEYQDDLGTFTAFDFAEHIRNEPQSFRLSASLGPMGHLGLTLLLRDRYFPTLWPNLVGPRPH